MTDLYLKTLTEKDMNAALLEAGVIDNEGNPVDNFLVDQIGPFTKVIGYDEEGQPIEEYYPDWHTNLRGSFDEAQLALLTPLSVEPPVPYRVWA
jgi:protocatechuate 3,4-dioxygenase beta subunit